MNINVDDSVIFKFGSQNTHEILESRFTDAFQNAQIAEDSMV